MHFRGRRSTKDVFMRDVRRSGRWFPERGCILEYQMCRFAKMILRDRCSTSCDLASIFRGRRSTLDRWTGKIAKRIGTSLPALHSTFHFWRKSRRIASFRMLSSSKNEDVSWRAGSPQERGDLIANASVDIKPPHKLAQELSPGSQSLAGMPMCRASKKTCLLPMSLNAFLRSVDSPAKCWPDWSMNSICACNIIQTSVVSRLGRKPSASGGSTSTSCLRICLVLSRAHAP